MRYDSENQLIRISLGEFVAISRRGISGSLSYDEDEPNISPVASARLRGIIGEMTDERLCYRFIDGEYTFELSARIEAIRGSEITIARSIEGSPSRAKKSEIAEIRGEAPDVVALQTLENGLKAFGINE